MKKAITMLLAITLTISLVSCGKEKTTTVLPDSSAEQSVTSDDSTSANQDEQSISVNKNIMTVDVTFPASFYEGKTDSDIQAEVEANGFKKYVINNDGSVTFTMSKAKHSEMLDTMKENVDETIDSMLNGEEAVTSFKKIEYNDSLSRFDISVDEAAFTDSLDALNTLTFLFSGVYYQVFDGIDPEEIDVVINYYNADTNDLIDSSSYQDMIASMADTETQPSFEIDEDSSENP